MVVWAANFIVVKDVDRDLPPVAFTSSASRSASMALLLHPALARGRDPAAAPRRRGGSSLLGALGFGIYQILWTVGLQTIPAGDSALLIAATPVFTAVIAAAIGADTLTGARRAGVARLVRRRRASSSPPASASS